MPLGATWLFDLSERIMPSRWPESARQMDVSLSTGTYTHGTVLGELTATPGTFAPYNSGHADGTQTAKAILQYDCVVDGSGNITLPGEWGATVLAVPVWISGYFRSEQLTGMDSAGLANLSGHVVEGNLTTGEIHF